jgi:hypothetical protein
MLGGLFPDAPIAGIRRGRTEVNFLTRVCPYPPLNSCWSHAFANCQSRRTVRGELFSTSAVSS